MMYFLGKQRGPQKKTVGKRERAKRKGRDILEDKTTTPCEKSSPLIWKSAV